MDEKLSDFTNKNEVNYKKAINNNAKTQFETIFEVISLTIDSNVEKSKMQGILNISHLVEEIKASKILGISGFVDGIKTNDQEDHIKLDTQKITVKKLFEKNKISDNNIDDKILFYLAAKVLLVFKNGLSDIMQKKADEANINPINYNIILNYPHKFKDIAYNGTTNEIKKEKDFFSGFDVQEDLTFNHDCMDTQNFVKYIIRKQVKVNLKELASKKVSFSEIAFEYNFHQSDREISDFLELRGNELWLENFQHTLMKFFEYSDNKAKIFYQYVIKLHSYSMREEILKYYTTADKSDQMFKSDFKNYYEALKYKYNLLVILRTYNFLTGVSVRFHFFGKKKIELKIFANEISYLKLAEYFKYQLQLKPYAHKYQLLESKCIVNTEQIKIKSQADISSISRAEFNKNQENNNRIKKSEKENDELRCLLDDEIIYFDINEKIKETNQEHRKLKIDEFDVNNHLLYPPYISCNKRYISKFRNYDIKTDDYLDNDENTDFINFSEITRNINNETQKLSVKRSDDSFNKVSANQKQDDHKNVYCNKETSGPQNLDIIEFFADLRLPQLSSGSSIFRSIDKLRLLSTSFDHIFNLSKLRRIGMLEMSHFKRNEEAYIYNNSKSSLLCDSINVFNTSTNNRFINHMKNLYGEEISFYLLWLQEILRYLIFIAIIGIFMYILKKANHDPDSKVLFSIFNIEMKALDLIRLLICFIISIWFMIFINHWKSIEKLYSYIWGCESSEDMEPYQESFTDYVEVKFIFDWKIKAHKKIIYFIKRLISYIISIFLVALVIYVNSFLFYLKKIKLNQDKESLIWNYLPPAANACLIKLLSYIYRYIAGNLSYWENHPKNSIRVSNLSFKIFIFEFVNNFFTYYYIGFYKYYKNECVRGNCMKELELQSYVSFSIFASINLLEIGLPYIIYKHTLQKIIKKSWNSDASSILVYDDMLKTGLKSLDSDSLIEDYIEIIIYLAYIILLTPSAALTPIFIFLLILLERGIDSFKIYYFLRVEVLNSSKGISVYNYMIKIILYVGTITSLGFVLFSKNKNNNLMKSADFIHTSKRYQDFLAKLLILLILENLIFFIGKILKFKNYPDWVENLDTIKQSYQLNYLNIEKENLPHLNYIDIIVIDKINNEDKSEYRKNNFDKLQEDLKFYHNNLDEIMITPEKYKNIQNY